VSDLPTTTTRWPEWDVANTRQSETPHKRTLATDVARKKKNTKTKTKNQK
jgi:hypothetical protein